MMKKKPSKKSRNLADAFIICQRTLALAIMPPADRSAAGWPSLEHITVRNLGHQNEHIRRGITVANAYISLRSKMEEVLNRKSTKKI